MHYSLWNTTKEKRFATSRCNTLTAGLWGNRQTRQQRVIEGNAWFAKQMSTFVSCKSWTFQTESTNNAPPWHSLESLFSLDTLQKKFQPENVHMGPYSEFRTFCLRTFSTVWSKHVNFKSLNKKHSSNLEKVLCDDAKSTGCNHLCKRTYNQCFKIKVYEGRQSKKKTHTFNNKMLKQSVVFRVKTCVSAFKSRHTCHTVR